MTFMHKLSKRLAMLKDAAWVLPALAVLSCQLPDRNTGPTNSVDIARLVVSPPLVSLHVDDTTAFMALGLTAAGDTAPVRVSFQVHGNSGGQITGTSTPGNGRAVGHYRAGNGVGRDSVVASDTSGLADTVIIAVVPIPVASVTLAPPAATMLLGTTAPFTATLRDSAGAVLTGRAISWTSTNPTVAPVNASGVATAATLGFASIIAMSEGRADTSLVTVVSVPVATVTVTPATATIAVGGTGAFSATPRDSAGNVLTGRVVTWSSTAPAVASVNGSGVATGVSAGSASIIATSEGHADTAALTVIVVPVASVAVTPATATIAVAGTRAFTATLRDSAGGILTGRVVTWSSTAPAVASVNGSGVATGVAVGSTSIIATSEGRADTAALSVIVVPVASVTVTPATATIVIAGTRAFTATLRDSAGGVLTGRVVIWTSTAPAIATVDGSGLATGVAAGAASIIALSEGHADSSALTVTAPPPPGAVPDPTLLPVGSGQAPNFTAYEALGVRAAVAGFSYNDPVTGVKIWKVTSPATPVANTAAGHDYSSGGQEVSRGWGPNGNTHTIHIGAWVGGGYKHWLVDFTRGVGFSNYRQLTVTPARDLMCSFSNLVGQERIMYIHTGSQLVRYNTATMQVENTGFFPLAQGAYAWLQQDKNDRWFAGMAPDNKTAWVWNSETNEIRTHLESFTNEVYLDLDGSYLLFTSGGAYTTSRIWDLAANTFGAVQQNPPFQFHVSHAAALRGRFVASDINGAGELRYDILPAAILASTPAYSYEIGDSHHSGMWIQSDADLGGNLQKQWSVANGESGPEYSQYANMRWKLAVGMIRADGSDSRLLLHHYGRTPNSDYYDYPWGKLSPDGKVLIFNSNMNNAGGRWDLFVAEVPLR